MDTLTDSATVAAAAPPLLAGAAGRRLLRNPAVVIGAAILAVILLLGLAAPWLGTVDPQLLAKDDDSDRDSRQRLGRGQCRQRRL